MAVVEIGDAKVSYQVDGHGPGLVLVHGTGGNGEINWGHLVERFATNWTVVRPDYAGSGATVDDDQPLSVPVLAAQVVGAARAAGAVPFDLVGFSLGACVAAYIAAEYPNDVRAVVLLNGMTSADSRVQLALSLWSHLIRTDRRAMAKLMLLTCYRPDYLRGVSAQQIEEYIDATVSGIRWEGMARQVVLDRALDVSEQAKRINKRTLVIGSTQDQLLPPIAHAQALAAMIPGAQYAELDSGHLAPLERPDEFAQLMIDFLHARRQ